MPIPDRSVRRSRPWRYSESRPHLCCQPASAKEEDRCARSILASLTGRAFRNRGTCVVIVPLGIDPVYYLNKRNGFTQFDLTARRLSGAGRRTPKNLNTIVYSQYLTRNMKNNYKTDTTFCDKREDVIARLRELYPGDPNVAVSPYAGMQRREIELDG